MLVPWPLPRCITRELPRRIPGGLGQQAGETGPSTKLSTTIYRAGVRREGDGVHLTSTGDVTPHWEMQEASHSSRHGGCIAFYSSSSSYVSERICGIRLLLFWWTGQSLVGSQWRSAGKSTTIKSKEVTSLTPVPRLIATGAQHFLPWVTS
jgi:hypothetical protein